MKRIYIIGITAAVFLIATVIIISTKKPTTDNSNAGTNFIVKPNLDKNTVITFKDSELEKLIRDDISKPEGDILVSDMEGVTYLNINYKETPVKDISGLENAYNLEYFSYRYGKLNSLEPVSLLPKLSYLGMSYSELSTPPKSFKTPALERVSFIDTKVADYSFLSSSIKMTDLTIMSSGTSSISFAANMKNLESIDISDNNVKDISPLKNKTKLTIATFHKNQISNLSVLSTCTALEDVNISYNNVTNLEPLSKLTKLQSVRAYEDLDKKIIDRGQIEEFIGKGVEVSYHK